MVYPSQESKRTAVLKLLRLKSCPWVHGLGIQAHLNLVMGFDPSKLKAFLHDVAQLGLKIIVTEMDVTDKDLQRIIMCVIVLLQRMYEDFLSAILDDAVISVNTWRLGDKYICSWFAPRNDGTSVRPLPCDARYASHS